MEHLKESKAVRPATEIVVAETPLGPVGLSICYDLRFPELYRELARRGARVLCVPSAFTERTGKAHWELLLRARAVENLAWVVAPAQVGAPRRRAGPPTGTRMIVDPWGEVVAEVADGRGDRRGRARLRAPGPAPPRAARARPRLLPRPPAVDSESARAAAPLTSATADMP